MLWVISCLAKPNIGELREKVRPTHVDYLNTKLKEGILALSGPQLSHDGKTIIGSVFLINVNSVDEAKAFSNAEPFTQAGIFASVTITCVRKARWNPAAMEAA